MEYYRKLVGERLYLSPFDASDEGTCTQWARWMNEPAVAECYGDPSHLVTPASAKKTLEGLTGHRFNIVLMDGDVCVGHISLHDIDHFHLHAYIGIFIGDGEHRGKGYGAEAIRLVLDYGFKTMNLHSILLSVNADNAAAIACYKKAGFRESGRRREYKFKGGKYIDIIYMDILEQEFAGKIL